MSPIWYFPMMHFIFAHPDYNELTLISPSHSKSVFRQLSKHFQSWLVLLQYETAAVFCWTAGCGQCQGLLSWRRKIKEWEMRGWWVRTTYLAMDNIHSWNICSNQYKCGVFLENLRRGVPITWLGALPDALAKVSRRSQSKLTFMVYYPL